MAWWQLGAFALGIVALILAAIALSKGKSDARAWGLGFVALGLILVASVFVPALVPTQIVSIDGTTIVTGQQQQQQVVAGQCGDLKTLGAYVNVKNIANTSLNYVNPTVYWTKADGKTIVISDTATTALDSSDASLPCSTDVIRNGIKVISAASTSVSSGSSKLYQYDGAKAVIAEVPVYSMNNLTIILYDSAYANLSSKEASGGADNAIDGQITEAAVTLGKGVARDTVFMDIKQGTSDTAFGSPHSGILFAIDTVSSGAFGDKDIGIEVVSGGYSLNEVDCSSVASNGKGQFSAERCYVGQAITTKMGLVRFAVDMAPSKGDPGPSDDPILYIKGIEYAQDVDGSLILDTHDSGGTQLGFIRNRVTYNLS